MPSSGRASPLPLGAAAKSARTGRRIDCRRRCAAMPTGEAPGPPEQHCDALASNQTDEPRPRAAVVPPTTPGFERYFVEPRNRKRPRSADPMKPQPDVDLAGNISPGRSDLTMSRTLAPTTCTSLRWRSSLLSPSNLARQLRRTRGATNHYNLVEDSVVLSKLQIGRDVMLRHAIIDKG